MKKLAIALSFACAGALAFADSAQWNSTAWITGIGSDASAIDSLDATGGTWSGITDDNATFDTTAKTLTIETESEVKFTVSADTTAKTAQKITVKGVFTPCSASDLALGSTLNTSNSQLGFAVVTGDSDSKYYAWVGTATATEEGSAIGDWVELATCSNVENETELTVALNYWGGTATATFAIKNGDTAVDLGDKTTQSLTSTAATTTAKVGEIACTGSGSLTALDGVTGIAVASIGDTVYGTVEDAIAAAGESDTVKIEATPDGSVTVAADKTVTIDENGQDAQIVNNGSVTIPLTTAQIADGSTNFTISVSGTKPTVTTTDTSKECVVGDIVDSKATVTVQTKADILTGIQFANKAVTKSETIAKFRKFLTDNKIAAYTKANTTSDAIKSALEATGDNTLALWQDYALGIEPSTTLSVKPAATDTDASNIMLALGTTVTPSGDYTIKYVCGEQTSTDASAIKVPATTGNHPVKIVFE